MISRTKQLSQAEDEVIKNLVIVLDLTEQQKAEEAQVRQELKRRRENGEKCIIKRGKIVNQDNNRRY